MVITDARLGGGMSGYQFLALACKRWPNTPFLMITAYATPKLAVEAIKAGAIDYLAKPFAPEELLHAVSRCAERHRLLARKRRLARPRRRALPARPNHRRIPQDARSCASSSATSRPTNATVLILGESGTGKELDRRRPAQLEPAPPEQLHPHQLRRHSREPARKRAFRP